MNDQELLELAAKAAGIINQGYCESGFLFTGTGESGAFYKWNPLTDDGDALRLAVKLKIEIEYQAPDYRPNWTTIAKCRQERYFSSETGTDPYAATRRAIVRAAAEIGKEM